jgi:succinate-acetate transporter protein
MNTFILIALFLTLFYLILLAMEIIEDNAINGLSGFFAILIGVAIFIQVIDLNVKDKDTTTETYEGEIDCDYEEN